MADNNTIARPYARAIFEIAEGAGALADWSESLAVAGQLLGDRDLVEYLGDPDLSDERRFEFLSGLFDNAGSRLLAGDDKKGSNFLKLLIENDRVGVLPEISEHFEALKAEVENSVDAVVTSAVALSEQQLAEIADSLKKRLGRDIRITTKIDETLIGGAVIRAGDVVIDGSLRARLDGLANALTK
ncbi:MAG: F0F1 ATP synthase subunit delta [Gammaproteobacteria bacterium]|nr:F0F1 ATP synthase subunit delta [Gammaproteobacteria bacterium]MDH3480393.1 F0F1 ATP synthase subunit delta [Gammaproteobacteria bacterium]